MKNQLVIILVSVIISVVVTVVIIIGGPFRGAACSMGVCKDSLVIKTYDQLLGPGGFFEGSVVCDGGYKATGGGIRINDDNNTFVWKSVPTSSGNGWAAGVTNYSTAQRSMTIHVVCMAVQ